MKLSPKKYCNDGATLKNQYLKISYKKEAHENFLLTHKTYSPCFQAFETLSLLKIYT